ncbi:MAG: GAF domain-containing protein [Candidatus Pacebacteria bacterium]|nr:GAF domain-containing protein [Candidatus Paceibacterota bacterium]
MNDIYIFINNIILIVIVSIGVFFAFWVYSAKKKEKINRIFSFLIILILFWITFYHFASFGICKNDLVIPLYRAAGAFVFLFFIVYYYFIIWFLNRGVIFEMIGKFVLLYGLILSIITVCTNYIIMDVGISELVNYPIFSNFGFVSFYGYTILLTIFINITLVRDYFYSDKNKKIQIQYFLVGFLFFAVVNFIFNIILPVFFGNYFLYQIGNYSVIVLILFSAHAIVKHELMGIKTLITQVLIVIMSIILLVDIIALTTSDFMRILKMGILITFLYFGRGLINSVKKEKKIANKLEKANEKIRHYVDILEGTNKNLEEGNEDLKALLDASNSVAANMDSRKIAQGIVDIIPESLGHLGDKGGVFFIYDRETKLLYPYAITESIVMNKAQSFLEKSVEKYRVSIDDIDNFVANTIREKKIFVGNKLEDFIFPIFNRNICKMIQKVTRSKSFVSVPLYSRGRVMGVLMFIGIKKVNKITQRDKNILYMFSSHIGSAIENARLYEQTTLQIKELARLNNDLGKANINLKELLEVKNEFLYITSHQLRTPLTAIRGMVAMWVDGDFDDLSEKETKKMINRILISTDRLNNITNDMLDALELEGGSLKFQFSSFSLKKILEETVDTLKPNFDKKGIYIKLKFDSWIPDIEVEPNYIRQVFMNTIDNACKYTKNGGVNIYVKSNKEYLEITIKDTGVGISKIDQKKIFEKFTRGKNASAENASGSGLGLFIARKIINAHNGKIEISSDGLNKGSTIKISLKIKHK